MKLPKTINIKGSIWKVDRKWNLHDPDIGPCDGLCDPIKKIIYLDRALPKEAILGVLLHEINHAIIAEAHLTEHGGIDGFAEEVVCASFASVYLSLFDIKWRKK